MAAKEKVVLLRHESRGTVTHKIEQLRVPPGKDQRLRCVCGADHFFVTKVDFVCTVCHKSYRD